MSYWRDIEAVTEEPVSLAMVKTVMGLPSVVTAWDSKITLLIPAARRIAEGRTNRSLVKRKFSMVLDAFPYYADTVISQRASQGVYELPLYCTSLWNESQKIKLPCSPTISVEGIFFINTSGSQIKLTQDVDFILDRYDEPARILPLAGGNWPAVLYVANAVQVDFTAGYDPDPNAIDTHTIAASPPNQQPSSTLAIGIPSDLLLAICNLVMHWFNNAGCSDVPDGVKALLDNNTVFDFNPTRG